MRFQIPSKELLRVLSAALNAVEQRTTIPILGNVLLKAEGDSLEVTATDMEATVITRCPAEVEEPGSSTVLARRFFDYVKLLPDAPISIRTDDKWFLNAACARSRTRIPGLEPAAYPETPPLPPPQFAIPVTTLFRLISGVAHCVPTTQQRFSIPCACLARSEDGWSMGATEDNRMARAAVGGFGGVEGTLIPVRALRSLPKVFADTEGGASLQYAEDQRHIFFTCGDTTFIQRKVVGRFPDYRTVTDQRFPNSALLDRKAFIGALERVLGFAGQQTKRIVVTIKEGVLTVAADSVENGEGEESLECASSAPYTSWLNGGFILDFLRAVSSDQVSFDYISDKGTVRLSAVVDTTRCESLFNPMS